MGIDNAESRDEHEPEASELEAQVASPDLPLARLARAGGLSRLTSSPTSYCIPRFASSCMRPV
jgi:hypothetical protein